MKDRLIDFACRCMDWAGWEVRRSSPLQIRNTLQNVLREQRANLVLDVGANVGQYGRTLRRLGYAGRILSFEPLAKAHSALSARAACDPLWTVAPRMALGDCEGVMEMHVSENLVSSSLLDATPALSESAPRARYMGVDTVTVRRLDDVVGDQMSESARPFLKLDVQGYEDRIIEGARQTLPRIVGIQCELSLVTLYESQKLWRETIDHLEMLGFTLHSIFPLFSDAKTSRMLQVDAIFVPG